MAASGFGVQMKVRQNAEELGEFMKDLNRWETDIKKRDEELKSSKAVYQKNLPPVRNQKKKKKAKKKESVVSNNRQAEQKRISSYDYGSWDKFNVDEELKALDDKEEMETLTSSDSDEDDEEYQEMIENERRLQRAIMEKDKGNNLFKEGKYEAAINYYTRASQLDPTSAVMPANRAMALLKLDRYGAAEEDCTLALSIDNTYTKAYLRRATARFHLNKLLASLDDYQEALKLEPGNKQAQQEIAKLHEILGINKDGQRDEVNPKKSKSGVPLRRIHIDEIGSDSSEDEGSKATMPTNINKDTKQTNFSQPTAKISEISLEETRLIEEIPISKKEAFGSDVEERQSGDKLLVEDMKTLNDPNEKIRNEDFLGKEGKMEENLGKADKQLRNQQQNKGNYETVVDSRINQIENGQQRNDGDGAVTEETKKAEKKRVFKVPTTSVQFQSDWKILKDQPLELYKYLEKIHPSTYPKLFQRSLESDVLASIIQIYHDFYKCGVLRVHMGLKYLAKVQRFDMAVMFLSEEQKQVLRNIFQFIQDETECTAESLDQLKKKYRL